MDSIQVKLGQIGQRTIETTLAGGATVADLARQENLETAGYQFKVNGAPADLNTVLGDEDLVVRVAALKGGSN